MARRGSQPEALLALSLATLNSEFEPLCNPCVLLEAFDRRDLVEKRKEGWPAREGMKRGGGGQGRDATVELHASYQTCCVENPLKAETLPSMRPRSAKICRRYFLMNYCFGESVWED